MSRERKSKENCGLPFLNPVQKARPVHKQRPVHKRGIALYAMTNFTLATFESTSLANLYNPCCVAKVANTLTYS